MKRFVLRVWHALPIVLLVTVEVITKVAVGLFKELLKLAVILAILTTVVVIFESLLNGIAYVIYQFIRLIAKIIVFFAS